MRLTTLAALTLLASPASAAQALGGSYDIEGTNPDGSTYKGTATITAPSATDCKIGWRIGNATAEGTCLRNLNALAAGYVENGHMVLVIYQIRLDGSLRGDWNISGQQGAGTEVLTPAR